MYKTFLAYYYSGDVMPAGVFAKTASDYTSVTMTAAPRRTARRRTCELTFGTQSTTSSKRSQFTFTLYEYMSRVQCKNLVTNI